MKIMSSERPCAHRTRALLGLTLLLLQPLAAQAQLAPKPQVGPRSAAEIRAGDELTGSVEAVVAADFAGALVLAEQAIADDRDGPWGYYVRAVALLALKRPDDAIAAFGAAQARFRHDDLWGESVAVWGQANALREARPCRDARAAYQRYVQLVAAVDARAAAMGRAFASSQCPTPAPAPYAMLDPAWDVYRRGDTLLKELKYDEAVAAYRQAEQQLPETEHWGRSIAIWGQANALKEAGRCTEASPIYLRYAQYVEASDPQAAAMGRRYAHMKCLPLRR